MVVIIIFTWLRMAEICMTPFNGDKYYDVDVLKEIDMSIYNASLALYESHPDIPDMDTKSVVTIDNNFNNLNQ